MYRDENSDNRKTWVEEAQTPRSSRKASKKPVVEEVDSDEPVVVKKKPAAQTTLKQVKKPEPKPVVQEQKTLVE